MAKRIFIAATMQNDGKTTVSLGLIAALKKRFSRIGFIKPIGQRYLLEQGYQVDEDSVLIEDIFGIKCNIKDMSPVAIARGFTERFIEKGADEDYAAKIRESFDRIERDNDLVIIEGTGHAGVGSVLNLSNSTVAKLLDAKAVLISSGGIGKPIDEFMLNKALFDRDGVRLAGVVVNKVLPEKYDKISRLVRMGLEQKDLSVLGILPYQRILDMPTMRDIKEGLGMELLFGEENLDIPGENILIGAMALKDVSQYYKTRSIIITPGDRGDIVRYLVKAHLDKKNPKKTAGIVLSGGIPPDQKTQNMLQASRIATLISKDDTYSIASRIHSLTIKIKPQDKDKIKIIVDMVEKHVDIDKVVANLT